MNLVLIYGPPGVGKLTTGRVLARLTGYRLFDNQVSIDCVKPVFEYGTTFWDVVNQIRFLVIEAAARDGVDLIITDAYASQKDDVVINHVRDLVERHGGRVCPVQLTCDIDILEQRVQGSDRIEAGKTASVEDLRRQIQRYEFFSPIPGRESLSIDNTDLAPEEAARWIAEHYGLPIV